MKSTTSIWPFPKLPVWFPPPKTLIWPGFDLVLTSGIILKSVPYKVSSGLISMLIRTITLFWIGNSNELFVTQKVTFVTFYRSYDSSDIFNVRHILSVNNIGLPMYQSELTDFTYHMIIKDLNLKTIKDYLTMRLSIIEILHRFSLPVGFFSMRSWLIK